MLTENQTTESPIESRPDAFGEIIKTTILEPSARFMAAAAGDANPLSQPTVESLSLDGRFTVIREREHVTVTSRLYRGGHATFLRMPVTGMVSASIIGSRKSGFALRVTRSDPGNPIREAEHHVVALVRPEEYPIVERAWLDLHEALVIAPEASASQMPTDESDKDADTLVAASGSSPDALVETAGATVSIAPEMEDKVVTSLITEAATQTASASKEALARGRVRVSRGRRWPRTLMAIVLTLLVLAGGMFMLSSLAPPAAIGDDARFIPLN